MKFIVNINRILMFIFYCVIWELLLCGSGQIIHVMGSLTLRMVNFLIVFGVSFCMFFRNRIGVDFFNLYFFYLFNFIVAISFSLVSGNMLHLFDDIKPLSYFFISPFFYWMIKDVSIVKRIAWIIERSAIIMAVFYLIYILCIKVIGIIDFDVFYILMNDSSDFMFRGNEGELFYKGFLFLPIGIAFILRNKEWLFLFIILLAIYFTMTRGFYIISLCSLVLFYLLSQKINASKIFVLFIMLFIGGIIIMNVGLFEMGEERAEGDSIRIITIQQVVERVTLFSFFFGHGFGNGVPIREVHMEMSYLEIFHKQGLLGIMFWIYLFYKVSIFYRKTPKRNRDLAIPFYVGIILVYIQSFFNPFINNPIGMSFILLAFFSLRKLQYKY